MSEMLMEILKVIVMLAVLLVTRYLIPWIKEQIGAKQMEQIRAWVNDAVLMAQQVYDAKTGAERKEIVVDLLRGLLLKKNIDISIEQLDTLIEAAVKAMKMKEAE
ncbi:MAG: phage holin family protein [bacterium]|nr:phage holin family protein [bacterium]